MTYPKNRGADEFSAPSHHPREASSGTACQLGLNGGFIEILRNVWVDDTFCRIRMDRLPQPDKARYAFVVVIQHAGNAHEAACPVAKRLLLRMEQLGLL